MDLSIDHISKVCEIPKDQITSFLHYPGSSFYSVIIINFNYNYDRVHLLNDVINDLDNCNYLNYLNYTTNLNDILDFYKCMKCEYVHLNDNCILFKT